MCDSVNRPYLYITKIITTVLLVTSLSLSAQLTETQPMPSLMELISSMTLEEKIGQLSMQNANDSLRYWIREGKVGAILNEVHPDSIRVYQQIAREESAHGIPLLVARDVIHGFRTIFPVPLAQAATWHTAFVEQGARIAAIEAASQGINWTFSPMLDVTRDPRWGRVVESFGEDVYLNATMGAAMVRGYQQDDLASPYTIAACAKHYFGYGWAIGGRDYNQADVSRATIHNHIMPPFQSAIQADVATVMTAFNDINGIPATGNTYWMRDYLRDSLSFDGVVVSDWESVRQLVTHGYARHLKQAASQAMDATVDMEMQSQAYAKYLATAVKHGTISIAQIDSAVMRVLRLKRDLGLFEPSTARATYPPLLAKDHLRLARDMAAESMVLLKNKDKILPLDTTITIALIGPMADAPHEQLGTWIFDGRAEDAVTPLEAFKNRLRKDQLQFVAGLEYSRDTSRAAFPKALQAARSADVVVLVLGEESIITGESHSRADITLPGAQEALIAALHQTGTPIVGVVWAGRPLVMTSWIDKVDALLYGFHPGTMGGPALADLLLGEVNPSGKLPITFPKHVGQIPIYYNHTRTGKPPVNNGPVSIYDIPIRARQTSVGNTSQYIDYGHQPLYPFGFGLSYTQFEYRNLQLSDTLLSLSDTLRFSVTIVNSGSRDGAEVVQAYTHDHVGSRVRPVRSLQTFSKVFLQAGQDTTVSLAIPVSQLAFFTADESFEVEPGQFTLYVGPPMKTILSQSFSVKP